MSPLQPPTIEAREITERGDINGVTELLMESSITE